MITLSSSASTSTAAAAAAAAAAATVKRSARTAARRLHRKKPPQFNDRYKRIKTWQDLKKAEPLLFSKHNAINIQFRALQIADGKVAALFRRMYKLEIGRFAKIIRKQ